MIRTTPSWRLYSLMCSDSCTCWVILVLLVPFGWLGSCTKKNFYRGFSSWGIVGSCFLCSCWFQETFGFFRLPASLALFRLSLLSSPKTYCVSLYFRSHHEAQVRFRKGLIFWRLILDISYKERPIREIAWRLFLIIAFILLLYCSKLLVTCTRAVVCFWIFFCRFENPFVDFWAKNQPFFSCC